MKYNFLFILAISFLSNGQTIQFADPIFKAKLVAASPNNSTAQNAAGSNITIDLNGNGEIEVDEASVVSLLNLYASSITDITGINSFSNIKTLLCSQNQIESIDVTGLQLLENLQCMESEISSIDVSNLVHLKYLLCYDNALSSINLSGCTGLVYLSAYNNILTSLEIGQCPNLQTLDCWENQLTSLNVNHLSGLKYLYCYRNQLTALDLSGMSNLLGFSCVENQISSLNLSGLTNLQDLSVRDNLLTSVDLSDLTNLFYFLGNNNYLTTLDCSNLPHLLTVYCFNNLLTYLNVKNGSNETAVAFYGNPNLQFICADTSQLATNTASAIQNGNINCQIDDVCALSNNEFAASNPLVISPNPVSDVLNINVDADIKSIVIFNSLGQLIANIADVTKVNLIDVSYFKTGSYFVKINTNKGTFNSKFIKL
jgi:hypothetical protein